MQFPFETSEQEIFEFEDLLKNNGLTIQPNSDLERICLAVLETNAKHKKEIIHDNNTDIREVFADVAGIVDFVKQILKHKSHSDFKQVIPHLQLLNTSSTATLTKKSKITDSGNNKLMELYVALLCMSFSKNIKLDHPENSKGDNPDVMFEYNGITWAIACKALHTTNEKSLYDTIEKGTDQINKSKASKGLVIVNFKNIIERNQLWTIINQQQVDSGKEEPLFSCYSSLEIPTKILYSYGCEYQTKLVDLIGIDNLRKFSDAKKCPSGFVIFLHAMTAILHQDACPATILKIFNLVQFDAMSTDYKEICVKLNEAMHNRI